MVNNRKTQIITGNDIVDRRWKEIKVGDIIQLSNDEFVTVSSFIVPKIEFIHLTLYTIYFL
jgi:magnesium-transporting ATPase (P-type)